MKKHLLTFAISCLAAASLRADVLWYESFNYPNGSIETNSGGLWICHSPANPLKDSIVGNQKLQVAASSPGPLARQDDIHRNFITFTNSQTILYSSFTVNCTSTPPAAPSTYFAHFYVNSTTLHARVFAMAGSLPNTWRLGI